MPHLLFSSDTHRVKLFSDQHAELAQWEMHDAAVNAGFGTWGRCPRGTYELGEPRREDTPPFGWWFIPLLWVPGRVGIGIHGGGSGLTAPMAPEQSPPWIPTHGCLRMRNQDLGLAITEPGTLVHYRLTLAGGWQITVEGE